MASHPLRVCSHSNDETFYPLLRFIPVLNDVSKHSILLGIGTDDGKFGRKTLYPEATQWLPVHPGSQRGNGK